MCYLTISVKENGADVFAEKDRYDYACDWSSLSVKACQDILNEVKTDFPGIKGGIIVGKSLPYYPSFCIELAEHAIINLEKLLSETFNVPFISQKNTLYYRRKN